MAPRLLQLTHPYQHGADVLALQRQLRELGFDPGPDDGVFGPTTEGAVKAFQEGARIEVDGIVGPETRAALSDADPHPTPDPPEHSSAIGLRALAIAAREVGRHEDPPGTNETPYGEWFGANSEPWCAIFVSWCFALAGHPLARGAHGPGVNAKGCAYVPTIAAWLRQTGQLVEDNNPEPGDVAIYNWDGGEPDHIGIVETVGEAGDFTAIEGNTAVGNDTNGGAVMRRERTISDVDGFGRLTR
jgi:hypothetical protein